MPEAIIWFKDISKEDVPIVGGKGANLGEMTKANIPVPPGFVVSVDAYFEFLKESDILGEVQTLLDSLDIEDTKQLQRVSTVIKQMFMDSSIMPELALKIKEAYKQLGEGLVAVRSSATAEDLPEASFAGQQSTYLNIEGPDEVVDAVLRCWASLFEPRAIYYRVQQGFNHFKVGIAVPVQRMIASVTSGVMFTVEPVTSNTKEIVIEAIYGLGEGLVSGEVTPDLYIVDKENLSIKSKRISKQKNQLSMNPGNNGKDINTWQLIDKDLQGKIKLSDEEIIELAKIGKQIEDHYQFPQDIEWAKENGKYFILQTRPVTTIKEAVEEEPEINAPVLLSGVAASPGLASGPVKIIHEASQLDRVHTGDILVTEMTTPDFVPAMKKAAAIVTDRGGRTAHAAIVSRELGIPCVVGTDLATTTLIDKKIITVDGAKGKVYSGKIARSLTTTKMSNILRESLTTKTKVYVNLAQPELADMISERNVDGVGLLRAEFIVAQIGEHPSYMLKQNKGNEFVDKLYNGLISFAKPFYPRPVVYRTTDFKTNEYKDLIGGRDFEESEENPMIGYRGASRYVTDIESFKLEIEAIKRVRRDYKNLHVMIPFVRTVDELKRTKAILEKEGLVRSEDFKLWMMVEVPSNIFLIEKFLSVGIDGISIGSNDLTQLILGIDRDSAKLASTFDERNEAVMIALERAITVAKSMGVTASICGQAPSVYPELTEKLVSWGITSVSVSPDMIGTTREIIAKAEAKLNLR
ncbi:MAG: phosphoenolpyruvate synthase [Dehalococcoidales bacterium]|jgi:pyruvate,water dikinase|nr:phosphoenolpyruvate synthase [Dehalococcoidales bacterium]MDD3994352.1 phosphoenolpyruvate synthase [Dehalococcoidales bacterium]